MMITVPQPTTLRRRPFTYRPITSRLFDTCISKNQQGWRQDAVDGGGEHEGLDRIDADGSGIVIGTSGDEARTEDPKPYLIYCAARVA
jgi:hypothetical protein